MSRVPIFLGLLALVGALRPDAAAADAAKNPKAAAPNAMTTRFDQVRERIDTLYRHRGESPPPADPRHNPFRAPGSIVTPPAPAGGSSAGTPPPAGANNLTLLQQSAATLKVSGLFEIAGKSHLVINARPYKRGDVVQTQVQGETVYLRVKEISKRSVTLELNGAELTVKF